MKTPNVSSAKVGAVAAGTYAGTLLTGAIEYFLHMAISTRYQEAIIGICVMIAVHFLKDNPTG